MESYLGCRLKLMTCHIEYICVESVDYAIISGVWKRANVIAVYKTGPRELRGSYRPVQHHMFAQF
jgi:hypothetical protein